MHVRLTLTEEQGLLSDVTALVLSGGRGSRMGGCDKGLVLFRGHPLVSYTLEVVATIAAKTMISANRNLETYRKFGASVITDGDSTFQGPLAGLLSGMRACDTELMIVAPCDTPFISRKLLLRLLHAVSTEAYDIAVGHDGNHMQPVFMGVRRSRVMEDLEAYVRSGGRKMESWIARHKFKPVDFSDSISQLENLNTLEEVLIRQ